VIVAGDSYPGMILRPEIVDYVTIVPPLARRRGFDGKPNERRANSGFNPVLWSILVLQSF